MTTYIATFFSHFGAIQFHKIMKDQNLKATLMPVPRKLSSSCGTCVRFIAGENAIPESEDMESLYRLDENGDFHLIHSSL